MLTSSRNKKALVVEDTIAHRDIIYKLLAKKGITPILVADPSDSTREEIELEWVLKALDTEEPDMIILDIAWNENDRVALEALQGASDVREYWKQLQRVSKEPQVFKLLNALDNRRTFIPTILLTLYSSQIETLFKTISPFRADRFVIKKPDRTNVDSWGEIIGPLLERCIRAKEFLDIVKDPFLGDSSSSIELFSLAMQAAQSDAPILISGETGIGKTHLAKAIHSISSRSQKPFFHINIATIPPTTLYSVLFGYKKGAFTGAVEDKEGIFEAANAGTVFLDEIGDLPLAEQIFLLNALEGNQIYRLGENKSRTIDVRFIFATNRNLADLVGERTFREDLYYRIRIIPIELTPLRKRKGDITLLLKHFAKEFSIKLGKDLIKITDAEIKTLQNYDFPGNIRQLKSIVLRAVALDVSLEKSLSFEKEILHDEYVVDNQKDSDYIISYLWNIMSSRGLDLRGLLQELESKMVDFAMLRGGKNQEAAKLLNLKLSTFESKKRKSRLKALDE